MSVLVRRHLRTPRDRPQTLATPRDRPQNLATEALRVRIALDDDGMGNARPSGPAGDKGSIFSSNECCMLNRHF